MEASKSPATLRLTAHCLCRSLHFTVSLPLSSLPLSSHLCHCSVCRYTHGTPCIFHVVPPRGTKPVFVSPSSLEASCTGYAWESNGTKAKSTRYFCSTCGCHMGDVGAAGGPDEGEWVLATSIFEPLTKEELARQGLGEEAKQFLGMKWQRITSHTFTESAPGGLHEWLPRLAGIDGKDGPVVKIWNPDPNDPEYKDNSAAPAPVPEVGPHGEERLRAQCHCGGVSFTIPRPSVSVKDTDGFFVYARPVGPVDKWRTTLDACDDCRLVNGTHIVGWTFIPRRSILPPMGADLLLGTSKTYASSPNVLRSFCGRCGATVFYTDFKQQKPDDTHVVDLATGILRSPDGPMARDWLTWRTGGMSFFESGLRFEREFAQGLLDGMKKWAEEHEGGVLE